MKKLLLFTLISILIMAPAALSAQNASVRKIIPGSWTGKLPAEAMNLRVVFNLKLTGQEFSATLDSPDQGAKDIPCGKVTLENKKLTVSAPDIKGEYVGTVTSDSTMTGTWTQNGASLPLNLKKVAVKTTK